MAFDWHRSLCCRAKLGCAGILLLGSTLALRAQAVSEGVAAAYLLRPVGARSLGLAGSYTAVANEPMGIFANAAAGAWLPPQPTVSLAVSLLGLGRTYSSAAYAQAVGKGLGIGVGIQSFSAGSFIARNWYGEALGNYTPYELAATLAGSFRWEFFSVGMAAKYLWSGVAGAGLTAQGIAADVGTLFHVADLLSVGASLRNLGGFLQWAHHRDRLPVSMAIGIATELGLAPPVQRGRLPVTGQEYLVRLPSPHYVLLAAELQYVQDAPRPSVSVAVEVAPFPGVALRGGAILFGNELGRARWLPRQRLGGGIAIQLPEALDAPFHLQLDYALTYEYASPSRLAHTIGVTTQLAR